MREGQRPILDKAFSLRTSPGMDSVAESAGQKLSTLQHYGPSVPHDQRQHTYNIRPSDSRTTVRKPTPSPLQVSESFTKAAEDAANSNPRSPMSPKFVRAFSDSTPSPRSPRFNNLTSEQSRFPRVMAEEQEITSITGTPGNMEERSSREATASLPNTQNYSQLRNVSSPLPQSKSNGNILPPSPQSSSYPHSRSPAIRPESRPMPRTSSIDSAISNVSNQSQDSLASGSADITHLIQTVGSPEAVIQRLLKEKQHSAAQNAQLWKLVDKQRSLLFGLNQDLERALKDKERYRRKVKEHLETVPPLPTVMGKATETQARAAMISPAPSEASNATDLPFQVLSLETARPVAAPDAPSNLAQIESKSTDGSGSQVTRGDSTGTDEDDNWVRSKARKKGAKHAHKTTSSSDVGVMGPSRPAPSVSPIRTNGFESSDTIIKPEEPIQTSPPLRPAMTPTHSFTAKRAQPFSNKPFNGPILQLTESTPTGSDHERMTPPRKAPPAPLDLLQPKRDEYNRSQYALDEISGSEYDDKSDVEDPETLERGRKKTREDDDREREAALLREQEERSRSKKAKSSKSRNGSAKPNPKSNELSAQPQSMPIPSAIKALSPGSTEDRDNSSFLTAPTSLAGALSSSVLDSRDSSSVTQRTVLAKPMSPGLPLSPRPSHRPMNPPTPRLPRDETGAPGGSAPLSPRGFVGLPLSPRAPRQPIPMPPHTPMSMASPMHPQISNDPISTSREPTSPSKPLPALQTQLGPPDTDVPRPKGMFRGFVSDAYPDLLLPPNALPSILVKVISSRLKPSRHSLVIKGSDEESVFTLGISARSNRQGLWQVEKPILSLQHLDQQLRQSPGFNIRLPDRSLFSGHAPAKVDARRLALEKYFEMALDTQMDEKAALILCRYLSTQASEPIDVESNSSGLAPHPGSPASQGPDGRYLKQGYLTKRGKNFGGWKARYFVLDDPTFKYYETPGGSLLGTIKLHNAQIGKQSDKSTSPSRLEEGEGQYRHAFLIREPKRKDSNSFMNHILCAESDAERDSWVAALMYYVDSPATDSKPRPSLPANNSGSSRAIPSSKKGSLKEEAIVGDSPNSEQFDGLQSIPYEATQQAEAPHVRITPDPPPAESPSPTTSGSQPSVKGHPAQSKAISAPSNGARIEDAGAWGNKPPAISVGHSKEQKKRGIWGFRDKASDVGVAHSNDSGLSLPQQHYQEQITNVKAAFGAPLSEAVEYCPPRGIDVCLPAVVYRCLEYLEAKDAALEEGIFRMSGSSVVIKGLRGRFNAEGDIDLLDADEQYFDVHAVASLLKLYLRELPQPVLTRELHLQFLGVLGKIES